jgi:DNA-binding CsgD family transcriptional regulator
MRTQRLPVRSVLTTRKETEEAPNILAAGLEALDLLNIGVVVTNGFRRMLFANQTAEQILLARDGLEVTAQGVLAAASRSFGFSFSELIQQAAQALGSGKQAPKDAILALRRASGKRPLTLLLRSLRTRFPQPDLGQPSVLVFVWDPELPVHNIESGLRQLFGLTSCEARLANLLMEGKTVDDCCTELGIRPSTVRMHLANLFAKTGVQRQGQLVSLLWKSVGMICSRPDTNPLLTTPGSELYLNAVLRVGLPTIE